MTTAQNANNSYLDSFVQFAADYGLALTAADIIADGKFHRTPIIGSKNGSKDGSYFFHADDPPRGYVENFTTGQKAVWRPDGSDELTAEDRDRIEKARKRREEKQQAEYAKAAKLAATIWNAADNADPEHRYLSNKKIGAHHVKMLKRGAEHTTRFKPLDAQYGLLLVPAHGADNSLQSLQAIDALGRKKNLPGGKMAGGWCSIGTPKNGQVIAIVESFSTGASVHEVTGHPVVVAFSAGNLPQVAAMIHKQYSKSPLLIAGDNDHEKEAEGKGNAGRDAAQKAAQATGGILRIPEFQNDDAGSDWNDFANLYGKDAAAKALNIQGALHNQTPVDASEINYFFADDGQGNPKAYPRPFHETIERLNNLTGARVKALGGAIFALPETPGDPIRWLDNPDQLFSWLGSANKTTIDIKKNLQGAMSRGEMFAEVKATAQPVTSLETAPEFPPREGACYNHKPLADPDFAALQTLIAAFCPHTDADRHLLLAFFMSIMWGADAGQRPAWIVHSPHGRGTGKSRIPIMGARLLGQTPMIAKTSYDEGAIKKRLLSPAAMHKRILCYDNETGRVNCPELAEMITSDSISGHKLYEGEGERDNNLTYVITLNTQAGDSDMSSRSVTIKLARPPYDPNWEPRLRRHIDQHRQGIWAAIGEILNQEPAQIAVKTRWPVWEREILARLPGANIEELQHVVAERQKELDDEAEEAALILEAVEDLIRRNDGDPDTGRYFIKNHDMAALVNQSLNRRIGVVSAAKIVRGLIENDMAETMESARHGRHGRGFYWTGKNNISGNGQAALITANSCDAFV